MIFFVFLKKFGNLEFFLGIENFDFFFFEKFGNLEFFQGIVSLDFLFLKNLEILNFFKELKILIDVFFFKQPKKYEPNAPSPKAFFENFFFFYFLFFIFFENFGNLEFFHGIEIFY